MEEEEDEGVGLKATLGLMQGCTIIVGSIIGSGIFIAPGGVLKAGGGSHLAEEHYYRYQLRTCTVLSLLDVYIPCVVPEQLPANSFCT